MFGPPAGSSVLRDKSRAPCDHSRLWRCGHGLANDNYWWTPPSRAESFFPGRMNMNIHWCEDTARFEKAETLHALDALHAHESHFFCDFFSGEDEGESRITITSRIRMGQRTGENRRFTRMDADLNDLIAALQAVETCRAGSQGVALELRNFALLALRPWRLRSWRTNTMHHLTKISAFRSCMRTGECGRFFLRSFGTGSTGAAQARKFVMAG